MVKERYEAGETLSEIADDFDVPQQQLEEALEFEKVPYRSAA